MKPVLDTLYESPGEVKFADAPDTPLVAAWFAPKTVEDVVYKSRQHPYFGIVNYFRLLPEEVRLEFIRNYPTTLLVTESSFMTKEELLMAARLSPVTALQTVPHRFSPEEAAELLEIVAKFGKTALVRGTYCNPYIAAVLLGLSRVRKNESLAKRLTDQYPLLAAIAAIADPEWKVDPKFPKEDFTEYISHLDRQQLFERDEYLTDCLYAFRNAEIHRYTWCERHSGLYRRLWGKPSTIFEPFNIWVDLPRLVLDSHDIGEYLTDDEFYHWCVRVKSVYESVDWRTDASVRYDHFPDYRHCPSSSFPSHTSMLVSSPLFLVPPQDPQKLNELLSQAVNLIKSARPDYILSQAESYLITNPKLLDMLRPLLDEDDYDTINTALVILRLKRGG